MTSFFQNSGLRNDVCDKTQENIQSVRQTEYLTTNYYLDNEAMHKTINMATQYPMLNYSGYSPDAVVIDKSSNMRLNRGQNTTQGCRGLLDLQTRTFNTIPFMGKGAPQPSLEHNLQLGMAVTDRKSVSTVTEMTTHEFTPLLEKRKSEFNDATNFVEGAAVHGWVKGGVPSREISKNKAYRRN